MAGSLTVSDLLDGHVALDLECLDRIYLNGYVPNLQVGGQVVSFMTQHLGNPIPSPAIMEKMGTAFRHSVTLFAEANQIPVVRFHKGDRKIAVMGRYLAAQATTGRSAVVAIGVAQEYQNVFAATQYQRSSGIPWFSFTKADRRVSCFYFYLWDVDFGPSFIKVCAYFPYPIKVCLLTELRGAGACGAATVLSHGRTGRTTGSGRVGDTSAGSAAGGADPFEPYRLLDPAGAPVGPVAAFLSDLQACGRPATTQRSYGLALLRWFRFLWAVDVRWDEATRVDARDFCRWVQVAAKPVRAHWRAASASGDVVAEPGSTAPARAAQAGATSPAAGKASPGGRYAAATRAHSETVVRGFYEFHLQAGSGPMVNPFPLSRRGRGRPNEHHNPMEPFRREAAGLFRPRVVGRIPRQIPDEKFNELFAALGSDRDRALVAFWVSTGARACELLGTTVGDCDPGQQLITVIRKGSPRTPDMVRSFRQSPGGL